MERYAELRCRCGAIEGRLTGASPKTVNRLVCYCRDCQAYLHRLKRADLLDAHAGTDIVQVAPAALTFHRGADAIVGLRLSSKGLYRWYAPCCETPLGNTVAPNVPFVGVFAKAFVDAPSALDELFGPPLGTSYVQHAVGTPPRASNGANLKLVGRALVKVAGWRFGGKTWPHPFFDQATRSPRHNVTILSPVEREALRPFCGPHPTAFAGS